MAEESLPPNSYGTVLVVGGCGFLGSRLVDQLLNFPSEDEDIPTANGHSSGHALGRQQLLPESFPSLRSRYPSTIDTEVHALDLRCTRNIFSNCTYHDADITSADSLLEVFKKVKPDVVINTASPSWEAAPELLNKVNIEGTKTLLEVAGGKHGNWGGPCKVFTHTSSASVVHDGQANLINADENYPYVCPNPREYYSETKVHAEKLVLAANNKPEFGNLLTCAVRPAGIVGEGDLGGFSGGILKTAAVAPAWQLHIQLGSNDNLFDNTYVHNVVYGLLCATQALLTTRQRQLDGKAPILDFEKVDGEAFNVTNNSPAYFWDSSRYLYSRYGRDIQLEKLWILPAGMAEFVGGAAETFNWLTGRKGKLNRQTVKYTCIHRYYSCEKLKRRTGYRPIVGVDEGFARSVKWFKANEAEEKRKASMEKKAQ
ncbi:uncharacterized protein A1O9_09483 [Exophiala aquamarina CBS 119918]|uniref:3-beta hydroxysteroid dehydrogenase/isomerase domain-containing protein n=1 Tax=Exophiala aquamarina CBS 119918 TaxID=1182545 RepID=A0A072P3Q7_9EURO|nr:uncharacterized protein A1O9_09483 [Exophiala aquamarina CBS 119918]KEF54317.1 hypothetical protein A1O9_09483 [Exophiala aquamarina CBS 119918]